jgi:hypothetical protein
MQVLGHDESGCLMWITPQQCSTGSTVGSGSGG